jgi:HK97 gp10 family phage protein
VNFNVTVEGFKDVDDALRLLTKTVAKNVMTRALTKAAQPIKFDMQRFAPTASLQGGIIVTNKLSDWHRRILETKSSVEVYVGPEKSNRHHRLAHLFEFGTKPRVQRKTGRYTGFMRPEPFVRPAWDYNKRRALNILTFELWNEIDAATKRAQRKAAKLGTTTAARAAASRAVPSGAEYAAIARARFRRR